ncbi:MAG: carboxylating nicotinate-nucleotide diphosphorylase [Gammaproteobacteria bacterium]|nr:carboxylating nicotinate-nucleotide diphosphorylase [Gammaproteobacteria bacterium]
MTTDISHKALTENVSTALAEDIGSGDITAFLIPKQQMCNAHVLCREEAIICGIPWVNEVFHQLDSKIKLNWLCAEGDRVKDNTKIVKIVGNTRAILTGERTALNFLQMMSGTATRTRDNVDLIQDTQAILLDTRKTIPGLRAAQKYAVKIGVGSNHRQGLFDAYLIKENHIQSCGGITLAIETARKLNPNKILEIEVKDLEEFSEAMTAMPDIIMLDNFSKTDIEQAVKINKGRVKLEASGGINQNSLSSIAKTGINYISVGSLTKHCRAIDLSLIVADSDV